MQLQRTDEQTDPCHGRARATAIALDNTNMSSSHSLAAGPLRHSEPTVIATAAGFRVGRHLDSALPPRPGPLVFVCCGIAGRTGRKVNRPQRQVEVKLKSAAGDRRGDDKPGSLTNKQGDAEGNKGAQLGAMHFYLGK